MAQEHIDELLSRVDSRYRLAMVVSRRAAQLKRGFPNLLDAEENAHIHNSVSLALKEVVLGKDLRWGNDLPTTRELSNLVEHERREAPEYSVSVEKDEA